MIIFPAIDIQDGQCVRLAQGDFATAEQVANDPLETALAFKAAGAQWLHMVDLDGAKTATQPNKQLFLNIAKRTEMKIELGGGIRDYATAVSYLENGIERVILGSAAVKNPRIVADLVKDYGDRIVVGIDAKNGFVQTDGWLNSSRSNYITLARLMEEIGVYHLIYTDIAKDGMLEGPSLANLKSLKSAVKINIIASGGITNLDDIKELNRLEIYGAICGKSLYKKTLDLKEAIAVSGEQDVETKPREEIKDEHIRPLIPIIPQTTARAAFVPRFNPSQGDKPSPQSSKGAGGLSNVGVASIMPKQGKKPFYGKPQSGAGASKPFKSPQSKAQPPRRSGQSKKSP